MRERSRVGGIHSAGDLVLAPRCSTSSLARASRLPRPRTTRWASPTNHTRRRPPWSTTSHPLVRDLDQQFPVDDNPLRGRLPGHHHPVLPGARSRWSRGAVRPRASPSTAPWLTPATHPGRSPASPPRLQLPCRGDDDHQDAVERRRVRPRAHHHQAATSCELDEIPGGRSPLAVSSSCGATSTTTPAGPPPRAPPGLPVRAGRSPRQGMPGLNAAARCPRQN